MMALMKFFRGAMMTQWLQAQSSLLRSHKPKAQTTSTSFNLIVIINFLVIFLVIIAYIFYLNEGTFTYTLDDPYIHLELARNIANGHYGVNPGEFSAPSSSILWPILLAPFASAFIAEYVPLVINIASTIGSILIVHRIVFQNEMEKPWVLLVLILIALLTNLFGLALSGMEHSLQVFVSLALLHSLIRTIKTNNPPRIIWLLLIIGPLIRYENLILTGPILIYLFWKKHYLQSVVVGLFLVGLLLCFSYFLKSLGLGFFPSSILAKADGFHFIENLFMQGNEKNVALLTLPLIYRFYRSQNSVDKILSVLILVPSMVYMAFGSFSYQYRYEIFLLSVLVTTNLYLYRANLYEHLRENRILRVILLIFVLIVFSSHNKFFISTPFASHNIFEQQYQMGIFAKDIYKKPVAINDLGLVTYRNDNYVLDLVGLASVEALNHRKMDSSIDWMNTIAKQRNVDLAMIYTSWFPSLPENWEPVAHLYLNKPHITSADSVVTFYAINSDAKADILTSLVAFKQMLPNDIQLQILNSD